MPKKSESREKRILFYSMIACSMFVLLEIVTSILTESQSVLMDAVYDGCELIIILISLKIVPLIYKPSSEKHPYGFNQLESVIVILKGVMMLSVASGLLLTNIQIFINGGKEVDYLSVALFEISIAIISFITVCILKKQNNNLNSPMIEVEIKGWIIDGICSFGMGVSFLLPEIIHSDLMDIISIHLDQIVTIILCICVLPYPIKLLIHALKDIFLFAPEETTMEIIREITENTLSDFYQNDLSYDVIRTGRKLWISIYFKPSKDCISINDLYKSQETLKLNLKKEFENIYLELLPDIEQKK